MMKGRNFSENCHCKDHSAVQMKNHIKAHLEKKGHTVVNFGTEDETYSDYPIYAARCRARGGERANVIWAL